MAHSAATLVSEAGGSYKIYNLGTVGDTDTEYLETSWDTNVATIAPKSTGTGVTRPVKISAGATYMQLYNNSTALITSGFGSGLNLGITDARITAPSGGYVSVRNGDIRPYDAITPISCGTTTYRWSNVASVDGDFSGTVTVDQIQNSLGDEGIKFDAYGYLTAANGGSNVLRWASSTFEVYAQFNPRYDNISTLGTSSKRWSSLSSYDGSFSGNLVSEVGGSQRLYNLGTEGDADTEYLETSWDTNVAKIEAKSTGTGSTLTEVHLVAGNSSVAVKNGLTTIKAGNSNIFRGSGTASSYIYSFGGGTILDIGDGVFHSFTSNVDLGSTAKRWATTYSVDGDFSGVVTTPNVTGTNNLYLQDRLKPCINKPCRKWCYNHQG